MQKYKTLYFKLEAANALKKESEHKNEYSEHTNSVSDDKTSEHMDVSGNTKIASTVGNFEDQKNEVVSIDQYKSLAEALKANAGSLKAKISQLTTKLYAATEENERGIKKLAEYKDLEATLIKKEKEIQSLEKECDMLADQYHSLATTSLEELGGDSEREKNTQTESLHAMLLEIIEELDKKRTLYADLEKKFKESNGEEDLNKIVVDLASSLDDRSALEKAARWLSEKAFELCSDSPDAELLGLEKQLKANAQDLDKSKQRYGELERERLGDDSL